MYYFRVCGGRAAASQLAGRFFICRTALTRLADLHTLLAAAGPNSDMADRAGKGSSRASRTLDPKPARAAEPAEHWIPILQGAAEPAAPQHRARTACAHCSQRGAGYAEDPRPVGMQFSRSHHPSRVACGSVQQHLRAKECRNSFREGSGCQVRSRVRFRCSFPTRHMSRTSVLIPSLPTL